VWAVTDGPDLPRAVGNNAVAAATLHGRPWLFTFLGLESGKDHRAITTQAFALDVERGHWETVPAGPGRVGRRAATAQAVGDRVYVSAATRWRPTAGDHESRHGYLRRQ
jgi:hypothetical protein